jgi:hypothetical protein
MRKALLLVSFLVGGCHADFEIARPTGFVELEDQTAYDWRATTADGLVLAVREIDHDPPGAIDFWTKAVENVMRQRGGYALLGTQDVRTQSGLSGKQLRFGHDEGSKPHLYYVTLIVTQSKIYLLEAGGTKDQVERNSPQLDWAIQNFRPEKCVFWPFNGVCRTLSAGDQPEPTSG